MNKEELRTSLEELITYSFSRSGGKGGQNVNKVNTKVHASVRAALIRGLTDEEKEHMTRMLQTRINNDGELTCDVQDERTQERNRALAFSRIESLILQAAAIPRKRKKTKPTYSSCLARLEHKKLKSLLKKNRQRREYE